MMLDAFPDRMVSAVEAALSAQRSVEFFKRTLAAARGDSSADQRSCSICLEEDLKEAVKWIDMDSGSICSNDKQWHAVTNVHQIIEHHKKLRKHLYWKALTCITLHYCDYNRLSRLVFWKDVGGHRSGTVVHHRVCTRLSQRLFARSRQALRNMSRQLAVKLRELCWHRVLIVWELWEMEGINGCVQLKNAVPVHPQLSNALDSCLNF